MLDFLPNDYQLNETEIETILSYVLPEVLKDVNLVDGTLEILSEIFLESIDLVHDTCREDILTIFNQILKLNYQAVKMFDSTGKVPSGILKGNLKSWGKSSICQSVKYIPTANDPMDQNQRVILGKFFTTEFHIPDTTLVNFEFGICLPHTCSNEDLIKLFPDASVPSIAHIESRAKEDSCNQDGTIFKILGILVGAILVVSSLVYSFCYELLMSKFPAQIGRMLKSSKASYHLLTRFDYFSHKKVVFLDILKFLSLQWVLLFLTFYYSVPVLKNGAQLVDLSFLTVMAQSGHLGLESLFYLSGLISTLKLMKLVRLKNESQDPNSSSGSKSGLDFMGLVKIIVVNFIKKSFHVIVFMVLYLSFHSWTGAWGIESQKFCTSEAENCLKNWWQNLLLIQDLAGGACLEHSKFIAMGQGLGNIFDIYKK